MKTRSLQILVEIGRYGNISRAAVALGISQPQLSQTLAELEAEFGGKLFSRTGRGTIATSAGENAMALARDILSDLAGVKAEIAAIAGGGGEQIVIGMTPSVAPLLVPPLIRALRAAMPQAQVRIVESYSGRVQRALTDGELDIGILYSVQSAAGMPTEHILVERLLLVGRADDPVLERLEIPFWEAARLPLVLPGREHGLRKLIDKAARRAGILPGIELEIDALRPTLDLCAAGGLYTILPGCAVARDIAAGLLGGRRIVDPDMTRALGLSTTTAHPLTPSARTAARLCIETARKLVRDGNWLAEA